MGRLIVGLALLPFLAGVALAADRLSDLQLARVTFPLSLPGTICSYSDCIPPAWNATFAWLQIFERTQNGNPTIVQGTAPQLPTPTSTSGY